MSFILLRSIPLSAETMTAWRSADIRIIPGHPELSEVEPYVRSHYLAGVCEGLINLGVSQFDPAETDEERGYAFWWNRGQAIRMTRRPGDLRIHMGDLLPPLPSNFPADAWIKAPGRKGHGKERQILMGTPLFIPAGTDIQLHVTGEEYRVITVFHKVVQAFQRYGENDAREYSWRGVTNTPRAVKRIAREASKRIPGYNMYAWDIILGTTAEDPEPKAYILEANSCPGANVNTVRRIIEMMYRVYTTTKLKLNTELEDKDDDDTPIEPEDHQHPTMQDLMNSLRSDESIILNNITFNEGAVTWQ